MSKTQKNVLGGDLELCSSNPLTGWYRDGCCNTDENDNGLHTVCAKVNDDFLECASLLEMTWLHLILSLDFLV